MSPTKRLFLSLASAVIVASAGGCAGPVGTGDGVLADDEVPAVGWEALIVGEHHDVSGAAFIVDASTIEVDLTYDGGGLNARLFLLIDGEDFHRDFELTDNLVGQALDQETLTLEIPAEAPFEAWNLITLWCIPAAVSFGAGVFEPPAG